MVQNSPSVFEMVLSGQHPVLQFAICSPSGYIGGEKLVGLGWLNLNKLKEDLTFEKAQLLVRHDGERVGSLEVSMWKYVEPEGFKVHDMWGRLACCLDQAKLRLPYAEIGPKVSSVNVLQNVLTGYFMVDDAGEPRAYEKNYFE